jgi:hypothetical protein
MTRRRLLAQFGVVAAAVLVALGVANAAYSSDASGQAHAQDGVASEHVRTRDVATHAGVLKTERSARLLRLGLAVLGAGVLAFASRRRRTSPAPVAGGRLGFAVGALGRGPPVLRVR